MAHRWGNPRRLVALTVLLGAACAPDSDHRCARDTAANDWASALASCELALEHSKDVARAVDAARAAYYLSRPRDVMRLATQALAGPTSADASTLLGGAQIDLHDYRAAIPLLETAARLHGATGNARAQARDYQQLSGAWYLLGHYREAQRAEAAARDAAERAHDERMMVFVDIARADIQRRLGDLASAETTIERALAEAREPSDRVTALLKRGALYLDQGHPALARDPLMAALAIERAARQPRAELLEALHLDLSYVERKAGAFDRALGEMEQARAAGTDAMSYHLNRGLVYADIGRLEDAGADLAAAEAEKLDGTWAWWVPFQRAAIAARRGDLATAIAEDRKAIEQVSWLATNAGSFAPTVIASHREPYLHLLGLYAQQARWSDVLDVIAAMDSQLLLDSRESAADPAPAGNGAAPVLAKGPAIVPSAGQRAMAAWRGRPLAIVIPGGDRIWRIDICDGAAVGTDAGTASALVDLARRLETDPDDHEAGRALGHAMLPAQPPARTPLALLVVGPLARAPLSGLRIGDERAIAHYALVRAAGFLPRAPVPPATGAPVVIGDPNGDLPGAASEARRVAVQLGGRALIGRQASRAAFADLRGARLAHIAAHTTQRRDIMTSAALELADGAVDSDTIARLSPAPRMVVLASCGSSEGRDDAGNGSLTNAFLEAGAELVVGTRWSVNDSEAAQLIASFYAAGGDRDAPRALGAVQLTSTTSAMTRAAFEVVVSRPVQDASGDVEFHAPPPAR